MNFFRAGDELIVKNFLDFAGFERELLLQRQREGIKLTQAAGKYKGLTP